jgi:RimJ/RimL family protein N-acetyltransferase
MCGLKLTLERWSLSFPTAEQLAYLIPKRAAEVAADKAAMTVRQQEWALLQWHLKSVTDWSPQAWRLVFCVSHNGEPVGMQALIRIDDSTVTTDSWVAGDRRCQGHATAARRIVLRFAYEYLNFNEARAWSWKDNVASNRVNLKVGYTISECSTHQNSKVEYGWALDLSHWHELQSGTLRVDGLSSDCLYLLGRS